MLHREAPNLLTYCKYNVVASVFGDKNRPSNALLWSSQVFPPFSIYTPRSALSRSRSVISPHPPSPPPPEILMGSNLSKFLFVGLVFRDTISLTPPPSPLPATNEIIVHRPVVELDSDNEIESYESPVFFSSPYAEENIVTISDSE